MASAAVKRHGPGGDLPVPGTIDVAALHALAEATVRAHGRATVTPAGASFRQSLMERAQTSAQRSALALQGADIERRARAGRVRLLGEGMPLDILFDLAAALAALLAQDRATDANILANRYLDLSPRARPAGRCCR